MSRANANGSGAQAGRDAAAGPRADLDEPGQAAGAKPAATGARARAGALPQRWPFATEDLARAALIDAARRMNPLGINTGRAGNLSLRWHRGGAEGMLITPTALPYDALEPDDIVWVALADDGTAGQAGGIDADLAPDWPARADGRHHPSSEWRLHRDLLAARAEVGAIVHTHSPHATTLACLPKVMAEGVPPFHYMIAVAGGMSIRCAPYATFGTRALSDAARAALIERRACLLAQHGMVALGASIGAALELAVDVEALCRMYWQALQVGAPAVLDEAECARVMARFERYRRGE